MRKYRLTVLCFVLSFVFQITLAQQSKSKNLKPNIILILADDLGYETIHCNGGTSYQTPNIDKLASKGIRFTNAYATPLCTPSRVTLMTGKYNFRNYVNFGAINQNEYTFGHLMKSAGYTTFVAGKWQLGETADLPYKLGFDGYSLWHLNHLEQLKDKSSRYRDPVIVDSKGGPVPAKGKYGPDIFSNKVLSFIEENKKGPFFLYYPMVLTHAPFQPTPEQSDFSTAPVRKSDPAYFKYMVSYMDKLIGQIVDKVEKLGIAENTIILYTGDNGTGKEITSMMGNVAVHGGKGTTTVPGTHVPLIAYWKGKTVKGAVYDDLIDFTDFMPTFSQAVNHPLPKGQIFDGTGFYDRLTGKEGKKRDWLYCYYTATKTGQVDIAKKYAQDKVWKLYSTGQFYNIVNDPTEKKPVDVSTLSAEIKQRHAMLKTVIDDMISQEKQKGLTVM